MPRTCCPRRRASGFTLIELLVTIAIIAVLIAIVLPPVSAIRDAVAQNAGTQSMNTPLCSPPWCDSLAPGTTLRYPSISPEMNAGDVLANGLKVTFDLHQAGAASQFAIFPAGTGGLVEAFDVLLGIEPRMLIGDDFDLRQVRYTEAGTVRFDVQSLSAGTALTLDASASGSAVTIGTVPEPAGWTLVLLGLALAGNRRKLGRWLLVLAGLATLGTAQAAVTTYTSRAAFDAAVATSLHDAQVVIENFDTTAAGTPIGDGTALHGIRYAYGTSGNHLAGGSVGIEVSTGYGTPSAPNFLGTSDAGVFQSGDDFSFSFAASRAVGLYVISNDALFDGDITLRAAGASATLKAADEQPFGLADGRVYFLGLLDPGPGFSSATVQSACCGLFLFNIDDIVLVNVAPVPEPSTAAFALLGLAGLVPLRRRRLRTLAAATALLAAAAGSHAQRVSLGDLQNQIAASAVCPAALPAQPRYTDKGDGTVCDAATGLMWEKKVDCTGAPGLDNPHCLANTYTWTASANVMDRSGTLYTDFLMRLNDLTDPYDGYGTPCFAGHCDWRIPTIGELRSLFTAPYPTCTTGLCIDPVFGVPAQLLVYWSSSRDARVMYYSWTVRYDLGFITSYDNRNARSAIAVRGGR